MRRPLASIFVLLLPSCESGGSSFSVPPERVPVCGFDTDCESERPPKGIPPGAMAIENDSEVDLDVTVISVTHPVIDARLLSGALDFEIPKSVLPAAASTIKIVPHDVHPVGGTAFVSDSVKGALSSDTAAVLEVGGVTALYVGKGTLRTRRVDGVLQLVPLDATKLRVVPIAKESKVCASSPPPLSFKPAGAQLNHDFTIGDVVRADGCTTVQLKPILTADAERQIHFCAPEEAWPFTTGNTVRLGLPAFIVPYVDGLNLLRGDKTAFELVRVDRGLPLTIGGAALTAQEDVSCFTHGDALSVCKEVNLGAKVTPDADTLSGGRAWVVGATIPVFTIDCELSKKPKLEIVARSYP